MRESITDAQSVLIVEDEAIIAMNLEDMLVELGHHVIGIAGRIEQALAMAEDTSVTLAMLDINLAGSPTFEVAALLEKRGVPFIFTSGYGKEGLIDGFRDCPVLAKPFSIGLLRQTIDSVLSKLMISRHKQ